MKGLLILLGESFRFGGQHSRVVGSSHSFDGQMSAATSHLAFINYLEKTYACDIKTYIGTYTTKYNDKLIEKYKQYIIGSHIYKNLIGYNNLLHNSIQKIDDINSYDFLLIMRIDLYLKPYFNTIFNPKWQTIRFPTVLWDRTSSGYPRVNDMMIYIPSKYYQYIEKIIYRAAPNRTNAINGHYIWEDLVKTTNLTNKDLDTMIDTFHDSDSKKEFNPLYYIVNREINKVHKRIGYRFDKTIYPKSNGHLKQPLRTNKIKCNREGCVYRNHTDKLNNGGLYCCKSCRDGIGHGLLCEKNTY
jgi:hypothetical protein